VSDEHIMPPPDHEDALQCVTPLVKYSSAHKPQFMNYLSRMYSNIEKQWIVDKMSTMQMKISEYFAVNESLNVGSFQFRQLYSLLCCI
jgi:hypothetical protein